MSIHSVAIVIRSLLDYHFSDVVYSTRVSACGGPTFDIRGSRLSGAYFIFHILVK